MTAIFVFGSNEAGRHGKGAALYALENHGAEYGVGFGPTGTAWAIPTKDRLLVRLQLPRIKQYVETFLHYARKMPHQTFKVTAIGTGLAGYAHADIAPMFAGAPKNCILPDEWQSFHLQD